MARHEEDREDLLAEARALVPRVELQCEPWPHSIVLGRRRDDYLSVYLGQDQVYHFDSDGRLRRAYLEGVLYRSAGSTLTRIARERTSTETILRTSNLTSEEAIVLVEQMRAQLDQLLTCLTTDRYQILRQVSETDDPLLLLTPLIRQAVVADPPLSPPLK